MKHATNFAAMGLAHLSPGQNVFNWRKEPPPPKTAREIQREIVAQRNREFASARSKAVRAALRVNKHSEIAASTPDAGVTAARIRKSGVM